MKKLEFKSLKVVMSSMVVGMIVFLTVVLVVISYNFSYNAVEGSYLNQLENFNKDVEQQIVNFYGQQINNAKFLAANGVVVSAVRTGNYAAAANMLKDYFAASGLLENIFISTAEKDTVIRADGVGGKSIGLHWGGKGFDDNVTEALNGKIHVGSPYQSPVTGLPVVLITVPIADGGKIVGIFGYALNIGTFSNDIVKDIKIGKTGYSYLCDENGLTFAHPKKENIFKLDLSKFDWGKQMLESESGTIIRYLWEGKQKIQTFVKNREYNFISAATIYVADINEDARSMAFIMTAFASAGLFLVGAAIYFIISRRLRPLDACKAVIAEMAGGNLGKRYEGRITGDEIGDIARSLNGSLDQFERLISEIITAVQNLAQAVEQISSGNQNLSQRTSEQASSLEEIASTIEQATATINQNAENASRARDLTDAGAGKSIEGNRIALEAVNSIVDMNDSSKRVADIIAVINEIAFQTNLLALNAAVEAARAGEQGRGFAVVAGEVRNLAQRSGNAAKEIEMLINDTVKKVERSTELVNRTGTALNEIAEAAKTSAQIIQEIAAASIEQKQGINQINNAIAEMDNMTQQNASLVEETASASEEMANQAQELLDMMGKFKISDGISEGAYGERRAAKRIHISDAAGAGAPKKRSAKDGGNGKSAAAGHGAPLPAAGEMKNHDIKKLLAGEGFEEF